MEVSNQTFRTVNGRAIEKQFSQQAFPFAKILFGGKGKRETVHQPRGASLGRTPHDMSLQGWFVQYAEPVEHVLCCLGV
jgi:hypothetical protein